MHMRLEKHWLQPSHKLNMIMMADVLNCRGRGGDGDGDPEKLGEEAALNRAAGGAEFK